MRLMLAVLPSHGKKHSTDEIMSSTFVTSRNFRPENGSHPIFVKEFICCAVAKSSREYRNETAFGNFVKVIPNNQNNEEKKYELRG
jgi:hypothetical protein